MSCPELVVGLGAPALVLAAIWWITRVPRACRASVVAVGHQEWRVDSARLKINGQRFRRVRVLFDGETVRAFTQDGTLVGELAGAVRVPVGPTTWEFRADSTVWQVRTGGCCGDR